MKCLGNMERLHLPNDLVMQLFKLYEQKGQSYYYKALFSRDDEVMARTTLELDTQALAYYLKLNLTPARIKLLSDPKAVELISQSITTDVILINVILIALAIYALVKLFRYVFDDE